MQLRTNGSVKVDSSFAVVGGTLRDNHGVWIIGFSCQLGRCSILEVELWGI
ncbi:hypothetical protein Gotri_007864 [Gossypium trilobum]|uniref:Uncharacterized protein n=1 Tax=Gossypium trilobum TaxID=34281 RepID=A0A7J9EJ38_9ROSI|nr:hypothetical protein [Gossypium trilobum]